MRLGPDVSCMGWAIKGGGSRENTGTRERLAGGLGEQGSSCREL